MEGWEEVVKKHNLKKKDKSFLMPQQDTVFAIPTGVYMERFTPSTMAVFNRAVNQLTNAGFDIRTASVDLVATQEELDILTRFFFFLSYWSSPLPLLLLFAPL